MKKQIYFIHGAGEGAYMEDEKLKSSLQKELGTDYKVHYPALPDEANAPFHLWKQEIEKDISSLKAPVVLLGHSIGASHLAKMLTDMEVPIPIAGVFLLSTPFWGGEGWLYDGFKALELPKDAGEKFPKEAKVFLYQCEDDEIVPFTHMRLYAQLFPQATLRKIKNGGHQLGNDLSLVAEDIRSLAL